eukprot:7981412-Ditylum_brightwellii.AAC.1
MLEGLKIANKANNILFDSAQIAEVNYNEKEFNNNDKSYSPSESSNSNDDNNDDLPDLLMPTDSNSDLDSESDSDDEYKTDSYKEEEDAMDYMDKNELSEIMQAPPQHHNAHQPAEES